MVEHRTLRMDGRQYFITVSDEREALLAADAAGRAIIGVINPQIPDQSLPCLYAVECAEDVDEELLLKVQRRKMGLPWIIAETKRLIIREFTENDPLCTEQVDDDRVFMDRDLLTAYIKNQYGFFGYGIWALTEKDTDEVIGKAGLTGNSLGYHIYKPWRGQGYAVEACQAIIAYACESLEMETLTVETDMNNEASIRTARRLGFHMTDQMEKIGGCVRFEKSCFFNVQSI